MSVACLDRLPHGRVIRHTACTVTIPFGFLNPLSLTVHQTYQNCTTHRSSYPESRAGPPLRDACDRRAPGRRQTQAHRSRLTPSIWLLGQGARVQFITPCSRPQRCTRSHACGLLGEVLLGLLATKHARVRIILLTFNCDPCIVLAQRGATVPDEEGTQRHSLAIRGHSEGTRRAIGGQLEGNWRAIGGQLEGN